MSRWGSCCSHTFVSVYLSVCMQVRTWEDSFTTPPLSCTSGGISWERTIPSIEATATWIQQGGSHGCLESPPPAESSRRRIPYLSFILGLDWSVCTFCIVLWVFQAYPHKLLSLCCVYIAVDPMRWFNGWLVRTGDILELCCLNVHPRFSAAFMAGS